MDTPDAAYGVNPGSLYESVQSCEYREGRINRGASADRRSIFKKKFGDGTNQRDDDWIEELRLEWVIAAGTRRMRKSAARLPWEIDLTWLLRVSVRDKPYPSRDACEPRPVTQLYLMHIGRVQE